MKRDADFGQCVSVWSWPIYNSCLGIRVEGLSRAAKQNFQCHGRHYSSVTCT